MGPKPDIPAKIRGEFKPIAMPVPAIQVCELMPRTALQMEKICVLRGMATDDDAHSSSGYWMLTGVPHQPPNAENATPGTPKDEPCVAAVMQRLRPGDGGHGHRGHAFSLALAAGGVRGGRVYGASDAVGGQPREGRVQPQDLTATIFRCLGFSPHAEIHDGLDRPLPLSRGEAIRAAVGG